MLVSILTHTGWNNRIKRSDCSQFQSNLFSSSKASMHPFFHSTGSNAACTAAFMADSETMRSSEQALHNGVHMPDCIMCWVETKSSVGQ